MDRDDFIILLNRFKNKYITECEYEVISRKECTYKVKCINELLEELDE